MRASIRATRLVLPLLLVAAVPTPLAAESPPPISASRQQADVLVHKMIAAYGGMERWNAVRSATFTLRDLAYGLGTGKPVVAETRQFFSKDPRPMLRIDLRIGPHEHSKMFDGLEAWMTIDGELIRKGQAVYGRIREAAKNTMLWLSFPFNLVQPGTRVDYLGDARFMGMDTYVLQVSWAAQHAINPDDVYRFYVNKLTHLVVREVFFLHGESENRIETLYGDYRGVGGLVKDHLREIVASADGRKLQRIEIEDLRFGLDLPEDLFRKPPDPMLVPSPQE